MIDDFIFRLYVNSSWFSSPGKITNTFICQYSFWVCARFVFFFLQEGVQALISDDNMSAKMWAARVQDPTDEGITLRNKTQIQPVAAREKKRLMILWTWWMAENSDDRLWVTGYRCKLSTIPKTLKPLQSLLSVLLLWKHVWQPLMCAKLAFLSVEPWQNALSEVIRRCVTPWPRVINTIIHFYEDWLLVVTDWNPGTLLLVWDTLSLPSRETVKLPHIRDDK